MLAGALAVATAPACGGDGPSADESRVCDAVQKIVDDLGAGRSEAAVATLAELEQAFLTTSNEAMANAGAEFFDVLRIDIDRYELTVEQVAEFGQRFHQDSARALDAVVAECRAVGASIERLPRA